MSRLDELIWELCPDGVEYKLISNCVDKVTNIKWAKSDGSEYQYIDLTSVDRDTHTITETQTINAENAPSRAQQIIKSGDILFGATRPMLKRYCMIDDSFDGQICSTGFCVLRAKENVALQRWLYHNISSTDFFSHVEKLQKGASYPAISDADVKSYRIPIPPIEVQREIVRILDKFTTLSAELSAELSTRKKQYEYYRDELLHLDGEHVTIEDLFDTRNGFTPSKQEPLFWEDGTLPWFKLDDLNDKGRVLSDSYLHITPQALKKSGLFPGNSIIISTSATIGEYALITVPFLCNQRFTCMTVKPKYYDSVNIKYLMHYCPMLSKFCKEHLNQGNFASVDMKQFFKFEFVIPSVEKQNRIVSILDRFDTLCNDISSGLPAEIEARRKQYEYYRDKLLTFKERS